MADEDADGDADEGSGHSHEQGSESTDGGLAGTGETWVEETDDDSEWRYEVVGGDDDGPTVGLPGLDDGSGGDGDGESGGEGVAGPFAPSMPVESGMPAPENALFVAAGVFLTLLVITSAAVSLDAVTVLGLAAAVAVVAGGCYGFFRRF